MRLRTLHKRAERRRKLERRKLLARAHLNRIINILPKLIIGHMDNPRGQSRFMQEVNRAIADNQKPPCLNAQPFRKSILPSR